MVSKLIVLIRIQKRYGAVSIEIEGETPPVLADPIRIRQVFLNLFLNAAAAMDSDGTIRVVLVDGDEVPSGLCGRALVRGDQREACVAAASIFAAAAHDAAVPPCAPVAR